MKVWIHENGHNGQEVKRLQKSLSIASDGSFGPQTEEALRDYQSDNNLVVDGRSGPQTRKSLGIEIHAGVDISHHQGRVDWDLLKSSGLVDFAWIKVSEGVTYQDPMLKRNLSEARRVGIPVGGYHFGRPDNNEDPHKEIENFVNNCDLQPGDLRPVFDFEREKKGEAQFTFDWGLEFLRESEKRFGTSPILYTGGAFMKYKINGLHEGLEDYDLWHAYYPGSLKNGVKKSRMYKWDEWTVWQWTGSGTIDGFPSLIDRNWLSGAPGGLAKILLK